MSNGRPRLLILSASTGNGHITAALAIEKVAQQMGLDAKALDTLTVTHKGFKQWYGGGYEGCVRRAPKAWGYLYRISDRPRVAYHFQCGLDVYFVRHIRTVIAKFRPDIVVCTHSLPQPRLARLRREFGFKIAIVVTDMYPHLMWLRGEPDHYFVPSEWSRDILMNRSGTSADKITVSGIPIDPEFAAPGPFVPTDPPTVTITVGGIGAGPIGRATEAVAGIPENCRIVAICGRNELAKRRLDDLVAKLPPEARGRIDVRGHVSRPDMVTLMHETSILVGKPGGLTTSEALAAGTPFVIYNPVMIPGQEEKNAEFLAEEGAGVIVDSDPELAAAVSGLLGDPARLKTMRENALRLGLPGAAETIVQKLCSEFDPSQKSGVATR